MRLPMVLILSSSSSYWVRGGYEGEAQQVLLEVLQQGHDRGGVQAAVFGDLEDRLLQHLADQEDGLIEDVVDLVSDDWLYQMAGDVGGDGLEQLLVFLEEGEHEVAGDDDLLVGGLGDALELGVEVDDDGEVHDDLQVEVELLQHPVELAGVKEQHLQLFVYLYVGEVFQALVLQLLVHLGTRAGELRFGLLGAGHQPHLRFNAEVPSPSASPSPARSASTRAPPPAPTRLSPASAPARRWLNLSLHEVQEFLEVAVEGELDVREELEDD
jgi:hypothetical protein